MHSSTTTIAQTHSPAVVRLLNRSAAWLKNTGIGNTPLQADAMIANARRRTGLENFGEGEFHEALSRLLESCEKEAHMSFVGKLALKSSVHEVLVNRLRLQKDRENHPAIAGQQIQRPLIITGLPRTGTTLLHSLLALDPAHRAPLTWEVMEPSPVDYRDAPKRIRRAASDLAWLDWLAPTFRTVHALGAELPQECVAIMSHTFLSDQYDTMYNVPSYQAWIEEQDVTPAYRFHYRFLQHLQFVRGPRRWILKAPAHLYSLPELLSVYPDACFVQTHRNPMKVVASVASLTTVLRGAFSEQVDPQLAGRQTVDYWSEALQRSMVAREELPPERIIDIHFSEIKKDPLEAVRHVYAHFGMPLSVTTETRMREFLALQPAEQHGAHRYCLSDFGLSEEAEAPRFAAYCERFGVLLAH
ncbi:MAG: sulfotransferase [Verrucomicrobiaceae bacterium]|nr:MAG: sulfotransferase [Verrucomicrobiaceae bacterium]